MHNTRSGRVINPAHNITGIPKDLIQPTQEAKHP